MNIFRFGDKERLLETPLLDKSAIQVVMENISQTQHNVCLV
jgi:hypothetical protein